MNQLYGRTSLKLGHCARCQLRASNARKGSRRQRKGCSVLVAPLHCCLRSLSEASRQMQRACSQQFHARDDRDRSRSRRRLHLLPAIIRVLQRLPPSSSACSLPVASTATSQLRSQPASQFIERIAGPFSAQRRQGGRLMGSGVRLLRCDGCRSREAARLLPIGSLHAVDFKHRRAAIASTSD